MTSLRFLTFFTLVFMFYGWALPAHAELTEEQKQALFLQSKKSTPSSSSSSKKSSAQSKKSSAHTSSSKSSSSHSSNTSYKKKPSKSTSSSSSTHHGSSSSASKKRTTSHHSSASSSSSARKTSSSKSSQQTPSSNTFRDRIIPIEPSSSSSTKYASSPITIEKSGILPDQGLEPAPTQPTQSHGWGWFFGNHRPSNCRYLTSSVCRAIDRAPVRRGRWKYIIIHNSGTRAGNARSFDIYHRRVRKMVNGLAYHFVIGNGVSSGNGEVEIGRRWTAQLQGGHVASDYLNDISLGICLVGDYNRDQPTKVQLATLDELISYLRQRVGRSLGHQSIVVAHKEINPRPTDCPGSRFPYKWLHGRFPK